MSDAATVAAGSPKLLELDKKDVEAVRSFLPGKSPRQDSGAARARRACPRICRLTQCRARAVPRLPSKTALVEIYGFDRTAGPHCRGANPGRMGQPNAVANRRKRWR